MKVCWRPRCGLGLVHLLPLLTGLPACLPEDARPPPGRAVVTVSPDWALAEGIRTVDGWEIVYDRFLLSLGHAWLDHVAETRQCNPYSGALYLRIVDMVAGGPQTMATLHALGRCSFGFEMRSPFPETSDEMEEPFVLGAGVSDDDRRFLSTPGMDAFVDEGPIVVHVAGTATGPTNRFRFSWSFRRRSSYSECAAVTFQAGQSHPIEIRIRGAILFHDRIDETTAELRFDPYAAADGDGDGDITLEELGAVPLQDGETLAARLYLGLVPQIPRLLGEHNCLVAHREILR
jgi:hypothetical protein